MKFFQDHYKDTAYLGDGVYVGRRPGDGSTTLVTSDGIVVKYEIVLEPEVYNALVRWHSEKGDSPTEKQ